MHISFKIMKTLFYFYSARHVSDATVSIIRSFLLLHMQSLVTVWCWVGYFNKINLLSDNYDPRVR
jgi:hypothetical protein